MAARRIATDNRHKKAVILQWIFSAAIHSRRLYLSYGRSCR
jgi:hypothetical protein